MPRKPQSIPEGFWKYARPKEDPNACWGWDGSTDRDGYGKFNSDSRVISSSKASYLIHYGPIPEGKQVLHTCDNRRCSNPLHLFIGDHHSNMRDAAEKGRLDGRGGSKKEIPQHIRMAVLKSDGPVRLIARRFGVSARFVRKVRGQKAA